MFVFSVLFVFGDICLYLVALVRICWYLFDFGALTITVVCSEYGGRLKGATQRSAPPDG